MSSGLPPVPAGLPPLPASGLPSPPATGLPSPPATGLPSLPASGLPSLPAAVDFLSLPAARVDEAARRLLGWRLTAGGVTARLTEVEAYSGLGADPASHAHRGMTSRNAVMFGPAGRLYVYQIYGMYFCANVVCGEDGRAAAVLLRAGEIVDGLDLARKRRPTARTDAGLANGPGKLMQVLGLDRAADGTPLFGGGPATLTPPDAGVGPVSAGPRVGVTSAHDVPWRFWITGDPTVSAYRRHSPRRRSTGTP